MEPSNVKIWFTKHAEDRISQRGITKRDVIKTIESPEGKVRLHDEPEKWVFRKTFGSKTLEVIVYWGPDKYTFKVKTAYYR